MRNIVGLLIVCCFLLLVGILFWPTLYRYDNMSIGGNSLPVKINRLNGKTQYFAMGKWVDAKSKNDQHKSIELPAEEKVKITGNASLEFGSFSGKLYNGSNWNITEVVFMVDTVEKNDKPRWERKFVSQISIKPFSTSSFTVGVTGEKGIGSFSWRIVTVKGYIEESEG